MVAGFLTIHGLFKLLAKHAFSHINMAFHDHSGGTVNTDTLNSELIILYGGSRFDGDHPGRVADPQ